VRRETRLEAKIRRCKVKKIEDGSSSSLDDSSAESSFEHLESNDETEQS
jgi:hypothetical protein